jgi:hypothetical protein
MGSGLRAGFGWLVVCALVACGGGDDTSTSHTPAHKKDAGSGSHADAGAMADAAAESDAQVDGGEPAVEPADLKELLDLGIADYVGKAKPTKSETIMGMSGVVDGSEVFDFDPKDGPVCFQGATYNVSVLDQGSDNLFIYLQGGGACLSIICQATTMATPRGVPKLGVLDTSDKDNPVAGWNIVYVPYCDGSVFGGDNDWTDPSNSKTVRKFHGVRNFSAALDVAVEHFPHPKKVLLAGSSAGGWGTIFQRALVRSQYPEAELSVFDDAGIGFSVNQSFVSVQWGSAKRSQPPSCAECKTDSNLSPYVKYLLEHDPSTVVSDFSAWEDSVIMMFTFISDPMKFRMQLQTETDIPAKAYPDRYKRFFVNGSMHTTLLSAYHSTQVNGVTAAQWLGYMVNRDPKWVEELQ